MIARILLALLLFCGTAWADTTVVEPALPTSGTAVTNAGPGIGSRVAGGTAYFSQPGISGTRARVGLSLVAGSAFADFNAVNSLAQFLSARLVISDSAGKTLTGYIKAAGTSETLGTNLATNGAFTTDTTGWAAIGGSLAVAAGGQSGNCLQVSALAATTCGAYQQVLGGSAGQLRKLSGYVKAGTLGNVSYKADYTYPANTNVTGTASGSWAAFTYYGVYAGTDDYIRLYEQSDGIGTFLFDTISLKLVTAPSANGVTIVSTRGGSTYNWANEEAGFDRNDQTGYRYSLYNP